MPDEPETPAVPVAETPEGTAQGDPVAKAVEAERRRQAGIESGRLEAIRERDEWKAKAEAALSGKAKPTENAEDTFDKEAFAKDIREQAFLDAKYPKAREYAPGQTDRAKLAQLEAMFTEAPEPPETLKPVGNNAARTLGEKRLEDITDPKELRAALEALSPADQRAFMGLADK